MNASPFTKVIAMVLTMSYRKPANKKPPRVDWRAYVS